MNIFPSQSILHSGVLICLQGNDARSLMSLCEALDQVCVVSKVQGSWYCVRTTSDFLPEFLMQMAALQFPFFNWTVPELRVGNLVQSNAVSVYPVLPPELR